MTVTSLDEGLIKALEPGAPPPERRLRALEGCANKGIPTVVRIDPIIPTLNDEISEIKRLIKELSCIGVKQITVSLMKPVRGTLSKFRALSDEVYEKLREVYGRSEWIAGYRYPPREGVRLLLTRIRRLALSHGLDFASCREGFSELNTSVCDGTAHLRSSLVRFLVKRS
jgi:DNA repair photolyase